MTVRISKSRVSLENIPLNLSKSSSIASGATVNLSTATGNLIHISGVATISSFGTVTAGSEYFLIFDSTPTLLYNATSMILNTGGSNYTAVAGDRAYVVSEGNGNWVVTIIKSDGTGVVPGGPISVTTSRSLASTDNGSVLSVSAAANITLTVPTGLPVGFGCAIYQASAGAALISPATGVTITPSTTAATKTGGVGKIASVIQIGTNSYSLNGGIA